MTRLQAGFLIRENVNVCIKSRRRRYSLQKLNKSIYEGYKQYPEKILQFGEGNFLRAFVDWQVEKLNQEAGFQGSVVAVQPRGSKKSRH